MKQSSGVMYDIEIGIFRLTTLDDGKGRVDFDVMEFVATDANGNPIEGNITLRNDTAEVTFTHSTWPLLKNSCGNCFKLLQVTETQVKTRCFQN